MKRPKTSKGGWSLLDEQQRINEKIGARLKQLRQAKGYTAAETFAFSHQIDRSQYTKYEKGADMYISTLVRLLVILDVGIDDFFAEGFDD